MMKDKEAQWESEITPQYYESDFMVAREDIGRFMTWALSKGTWRIKVYDENDKDKDNPDLYVVVEFIKGAK